MARFSPSLVLSLPENPEEVLESLELLNNAQLNRLLNWIVDGLDNSRFPDNSNSDKNLVALSRLLVKAHGNSVGIRASHFRRLAQILNTNKIVNQAV